MYRRRSFEETTLSALGSAYLVSKRLKLGSTPISDATFPPAAGPGSAGVALVFGNEVDGLSGLEEETRGSLPAVYLPMCEDAIRSYNLSNAVRGLKGSSDGWNSILHHIFCLYTCVCTHRYMPTLLSACRWSIDETYDSGAPRRVHVEWLTSV